MPLVALLASMALAGCADDGAEPVEEPITVEQESFELEQGKGAIAGLLVDDRFRPIQLTDDPQTEFQAEGFVLLQETGQQVRTTENGEFSFVDLDPGTYTLRVTAAGHEATPQRITVAEGLFNEVSLVARRVSSVGSVILTEEFSGFVPCSIASPAVAGTAGHCAYDASGDSYRPGPSLDYTPYNASLHYLVIEGVSNQRGAYDLIFREDDGSAFGGAEYGSDRNDDLEEPYAKLIIAQENRAPEGWEGDTFPNDYDPMNTLMFYWGEGDLPTNLGFRLAIQFNYIISMFLGEPEVDLETYCVMCE